ncbi:hypothetical protein [Tumebacillus lipolyticus]|uniref:GIY-YIG nuclease family protein n=1 Tax=Tumebacillus lipolyticus TaxID=1280370 RepID=A0ABW4ZYC7_9BACL
MDRLVIGEVNRVIADFESEAGRYDGVIYMMYRERQGNVVPLYIGKSEKLGKNGGNLSANIKNIEKNPNFCRWGYNYAYHLGDLSAVICPGHDDTRHTRKYEKWAKALFEMIPSDQPTLKEPIFFWMKAWSPEWTGVWKEFGPTSLTFLEYLLIGLASDLYPEQLLNDEGVNRK